MTEGHTLTDLLAIYLYKHKYLSLPKLGRFDVSEQVDLSQPEGVDFSRIPKDVITFTANPAETTDTKLVRYITDRTRKMQSLAVADLFTLTDQARQMLNIRQPVSFAGIGTLDNGKGVIAFTPGTYRPELLQGYAEEAYLPDFSEKPATSVQPTPKAAAAPPAARSMGGVLIIVVCLAVAGLLLYFMFAHGPQRERFKDVTAVDAPGSSDTAAGPAAATPPPAESAVPALSSSRHTGQLHYEVIFEHHVDSQRAFHRYRQLMGWGHTVVMHTTDSVYYSLGIPFTTPAADTAQMKDSIRILYGRPTSIRYASGR